MKTISGLLMAALLTMSAGCARTDWIDRTLVTMDVTGIWQSTSGWELNLVQEGQKVKGSIRRGPLAPSVGPISGLVDGTVAGDAFSFRQTDGLVRGEMTVSGDEMSGVLTFNSTSPITLRRVNSPSSPASPPR
jgi:hypothetical protein